MTRKKPYRKHVSKVTANVFAEKIDTLRELFPDAFAEGKIDWDKEQEFYICLDDKIRLKALRPLELKRDDLFICRDRALDDEAAANLALQCRLMTI